ncbi:MAG: hypothetical protein PVI89_15590 [Desulfobacteraceae bacterium]
MKQNLVIYWIPILFLMLTGCAAQKPPKVWQSLPPVQQTSNDLFDIRTKPLKLDNPFFVVFELTVQNKTSLPLEINWNRSRYLHKGREKGIFVFKGIEPETIKTRTIPNERIPAGSELTKRIAPARTIAWKSRRDYIKPGESSFVPGILPSGDNSISLVLSHNGKQWRQTTTVKIVAK